MSDPTPNWWKYAQLQAEAERGAGPGSVGHGVGEVEISEDDDVDCPECGGPTVEVDDVGSGQVMRQCQVCRYTWPVWP